MKRTSFFIMAIALLYACSQQNQQPDSGTIELRNWKFTTGDNIEWAKADFDDQEWDSIYPGMFWEKQGHEDYNGYAWYRTTFELSSELKEKAYLKDSLQIILGLIDDTEQTYLNGKLLGVNGEIVSATNAAQKAKDTSFIKEEAYNIPRHYVIPVDDPRIEWDKKNTIAIRVHDHYLGGGMITPGPTVSMVDIKDYLEFDLGQPFKIDKNSNKRVAIKNKFKDKDLHGIFNVIIKDVYSDELIYQKDYDVTLPHTKETDINYAFDAAVDKEYIATYIFIEEASGNKSVFKEELPFVLTPPVPNEPRINGAKVFGARPGNPFLFTIAATGKRPLQFSAEGLPEGLKLDKQKGMITGKVQQKGTYNVTITVENKLGKATENIRIEIGDKIALTPPMGWNSWNCWGLSVSDKKVRDAADQMVSTGLINHGWTYINIDDGWEAEERTKEGELLGNEKFPDFKALTDYVHDKGLKIGIYSGPGPETCGGYLASYQHECIDAQTWADWGIDYLKYDWCAYEEIAKDHSLEELKKPYIKMNECLENVNRDIVYSLCQYGMGDVWKWGEEVGGHLWRTTGDIVDTWESMSDIGFGLQKGLAPYAKPGHWNDPDMLVVGWVGWGPNLHPTRLTPNEQYTHMSLWALLSAPLLLGNDLTRLDDFTMNLLTNDEVIAINQDPLGKQAKQVKKSNITQVWAKKMEDGSLAVGLFNLSDKRTNVAITWDDLNIEGAQVVRDVWRQKDIGRLDTEYTTKVSAHGVALVKIINQ